MIAMPDCDEIFTKFDYDKVRDLIKTWITQFEYNFVFSHDELDNEVIKFMHSKFYNRTKQNWVGIIHEVLQWDANRIYVWEDTIKLEHYQNEKTNRTWYLRWLAIDCYENQSNNRNSHYLWRELLWYWHHEAAIKELKRHLTISWWSPERSQSMIYIWEAYNFLGNEEECLNWFFKAYTECSERREPLWALAELYFRKNDLKRVIAFCEAMLTIPQSNFYANFTDIYTHLPHARLAWAYYYNGDKDKARNNFDKAIEYCPLNSLYLHDLRWHYDLPMVSIIVPTLWRPEWLQKLKDSIDKLNYPKELIEVLIEEDEPRIWVPKRVNQLYSKSKGKLICYMANDTEFTPDSLIIAVYEMRQNNDELLAFNSWELYHDKWNICEHFIITRRFIENNLDWKIFDEDMNHVGVDNLLWAKTDWFHWRSINAIIIHNHFSRTWKMDEIYELAYSEADKDREILKQKLQDL